MKGKIIELQKVWLSPTEAKSYLGCNDRYLRRLREEAMVSYSKVNRMIFYNLDSINKLILKHKVI